MTDKLQRVEDNISPGQLIKIALEQNVGVDQLEKLMDLKERADRNAALQEFNIAMTDFKKDPPKITRNANVKFGNTEYDHATLDHIAEAINEGLSKVGIVYRWATNQKDDGAIAVTCILTHNLGHTEETTLSAKPDDSGSKNSIQQIGSTVTYLQRYTLLSAVGLAVGGMDNDGAGEPVKTISKTLVKNLKTLMSDVKADEKRFKEYLQTTFNVDSIEQLTEPQFDEAVRMLEKKKKQAGKKGSK